MSVTTGLLEIKPWGVIEWVTVRAVINSPDDYRIVYDNKDLATVHAVDQPDLVDQANKAWRKAFPKGP